MKKNVAKFLLLGALALGVSSCLLGRTIARSVIDVTLAACLDEHLDIQDEAALREVCKWTEADGPLVKELLLARRKGMAKAARAGACAPPPLASDGGT